MDIECSSSKSSNSLQMKLRTYTNEYEAIRKRFLKIQENYINQKSEDALMLVTEENREGDTGGHQKKN